jgi:hypothetical protein
LLNLSLNLLSLILNLNLLEEARIAHAD